MVDKPDTTTMAMRVTQEEKAIIEEAATLKGWSAAKLINEAVVTRAKQILNSSGNDVEFIQLATDMGKLLKHVSIPVDIKGNELNEYEVMHMQPPEIYYKTVGGLSSYETLKKILRDCGPEFTEMMLKVWDQDAPYQSKYPIESGKEAADEA